MQMKKTLEIQYTREEIKKMLESRRNTKIESIKMLPDGVVIKIDLGVEDDSKE